MKKKKAARLKARLRDLQHKNDELFEDIRRLVGLGAEGSEYTTREKWLFVFSIRSKAEKAMWSKSPTSTSSQQGILNETVNIKPHDPSRADFLSKINDLGMQVKPIGTNGGIKRTGLVH